MSDIIRERVCAETNEGVTIFMIGMRINRPWKVWSWLPIARAMPRMLRELNADPELGLLQTRFMAGLRNLAIVQYWRSPEHLQRYAHAATHQHLPAWRRFNDRVGTSGDVGIWHETFVVPPNASESIYVNMPPFGLGTLGPLFPAKGHRGSAKSRLAALRRAVDETP